MVVDGKDILNYGIAGLILAVLWWYMRDQSKKTETQNMMFGQMITVVSSSNTNVVLMRDTVDRSTTAYKEVVTAINLQTAAIDSMHIATAKLPAEVRAEISPVLQEIRTAQLEYSRMLEQSELRLARHMDSMSNQVIAIATSGRLGAGVSSVSTVRKPTGPLDPLSAPKDPPASASVASLPDGSVG